MLATRVKTLHRQESSRFVALFTSCGPGNENGALVIFLHISHKKNSLIMQFIQKKNICSGIRESILLTKLDPSHVVYLRTEVQASKNMNYGKCRPECK